MHSSGLLIALCLFIATSLAGKSKRQNCTVTNADIEGPYYQPGSPDRTEQGIICYNSPAGDRIYLSGYVMNEDCSKPLPNTKLDIWQANPSGEYSEGQSHDSFDFNCRAVIYTDENGYYQLKTLMPGRYDDGGYRPAHIHWKVTPVSDAYETLTTQLYFLTDTYLYPNDSCTSCGSMHPSLVIELDHLKDIKTYVGSWDIVMSPAKKNLPQSDKVLVPEQQKVSNDNYAEKKPHIQPMVDKTVVVQQTSLLSYLAVGAACLTIGAIASIVLIKIHAKITKKRSAVTSDV
jgi:protocatechuate 3,4-dioxygenase beta subunit